jgi:uncharacterized protein involved in type VI secretion and phage assembly
MDRHYACAPVYGKITNNADPEGLGRVKVGLYYLGKDVETSWIPVRTSNLGIFILPELGDQVVVAFEGDNPDCPFVLGCIWSIKQRPPVTGESENAESERNKNGKNNLRFFRSRSGNRIIFNDTKDNEKIQMISSGDSSKIELASHGTNMLFKTTGVMNISAKGKITINGKECRINIKKGIITQSKDIKLDGKNVNVKAGNSVTVKGNGINLN